MTIIGDNDTVSFDGEPSRETMRLTRPDRYEQLQEWPERRPQGVIFLHDFRTKTVYVCSSATGHRLLAIPFERFVEEAKHCAPMVAPA